MASREIVDLSQARFLCKSRLNGRYLIPEHDARDFNISNGDLVINPDLETCQANLEYVPCIEGGSTAMYALYPLIGVGEIRESKRIIKQSDNILSVQRKKEINYKLLLV